MGKDIILADDSGLVSQKNREPTTFEEVYGKIQEIQSRPENDGKQCVVVQFDGFAPGVQDVGRSIREVYPNWSGAGGFTWSVQSNLPIVPDDDGRQLQREHPIHGLPTDPSYSHVFLIFIHEMDDQQEHALFKPQEFS